MASDWVTAVQAWGGAIGTVVTAVATIFLWRVTSVLARETTRMVEATSQPQVVATIAPGQWSMRHVNLEVENTGNATAFDIEVTFDPPLQNGTARGEAEIPFKRISLLKPGQQLSSYLSEGAPLFEKQFEVRISWSRQPAGHEREHLAYQLSFGDWKGVSRLGALTPLHQIAEHVKKLQEEWSRVARGSDRLKTDVFSSDDRRSEREEWERQRAEMCEKDGTERS